MANAYKSTSKHLVGFLSSIIFPGAGEEREKMLTQGGSIAQWLRAQPWHHIRIQSHLCLLLCDLWTSFLTSPKAQFPQLLNGG